MAGKILVAGATGYVGSWLVPRLLSAGHAVRCLARRRRVEVSGRWQGAEMVQADLLDAATLPAALEGVEVIYYLVHSLASGETKFSQHDFIAAGNMAREARAAGANRIIYLGALGDEAFGLSNHLRSRQETGAVMRSYDMPVTEFRAGPIIGEGSVTLKIMGTLIERVPVIVWPPWLSTPCQSISISDVVAYLVAALGEPRSLDQTVQIGGADLLPFGEMMRQYALISGHYRPVFPLPMLGPRLAAYAVSMITPVPISYTHPLLNNLLIPVVVTETVSRDLFPQIKPVGYEEALRLALRVTS